MFAGLMSRKHVHVDDRGGFMVLDARGLIVAGARHELDMAGVEAVLMEREDQVRGKR